MFYQMYYCTSDVGIDYLIQLFHAESTANNVRLDYWQICRYWKICNICISANIDPSFSDYLCLCPSDVDSLLVVAGKYGVWCIARVGGMCDCI